MWIERRGGNSNSHGVWTLLQSYTDYTYDQIIIADSTISDFTGDSGIFRYYIEDGLSHDKTVAVSDHYPFYTDIWCGIDVD